MTCEKIPIAIAHRDIKNGELVSLNANTIGPTYDGGKMAYEERCLVECVSAGSKFVDRFGGNDSSTVLEVGKTYELTLREVHSWHTKYHLKEFPGKVFNSVLFEEVDQGGGDV